MNRVLRFPSRATFFSTVTAFALLACPALAGEGGVQLRPRVDAGAKLGTERSLLGTEAWIPLAQDRDRVLYGDVRFFRDDLDHAEGNVGLGYRQVYGEAVLGAHGWIDRRHTALGSTFHQAAFGLEILGRDMDARVSAYIPLSGAETYGPSESVSEDPYLAGSRVVFNTNGSRREVPLGGLDLEFGVRVPAFEEHVDSIRVYGGGYRFARAGVDGVTGWRTRLSADVTPWLQAGARIQKDAERGGQGFLEATFRFPGKASFRRDGLRARLDESPERDIDIVSRIDETAGERALPVLNEIGEPQRVLHVDNTAPAGGDGTLESPFGTLQEAEAALHPYDVIYIHQGDGTTAGQDQGITVGVPGVSLIGSGVDLVYAGGRVTGAASGGTVLAVAAAAPVITNNQANGDGVRVLEEGVFLSGFTVDGAQRHGIYALSDGGDFLSGIRISDVEVSGSGQDGIRVEADGAGSAVEADISSAVVGGNENGVRFYAANDASVAGSLESSEVTANGGHGVIVYDDSAAGSADVDLGGGGSSDGLNALHGNALEDIAVDADGAALMARNNWWGQAGGPVAGQVYYGAALNDGLAAHWLLDETGGAAAEDRIAGHDGALVNAPVWSPGGGFHGGAIDMEAASADYIEVPDFDDADTGDELTVSYWINPETVLPTATHIAKWEEADATNISSWGVRATNVAGDELFVFIAEAGVDTGENYITTTDMNLAPGVWTNIAFVYDGNGADDAARLKVYKNGAQVNGNYTGTIPSSLHDTAESLTFGRRLLVTPGFADYTDGLTDDVRIYSRALDSSGIAELYRQNTDSAVDASNPMAAAS